ncbi:MAG: hypothetical protein ABJF88_14215 [Rhodothermales bacterium]
MREDDSSDVRPPRGDPRRQATGAVKGFDYQIWQSVDLWTSLRGDEALFLEAAEDVDRVSSGSAETGQVKALARPLTLRSEAVQSALRHFWTHREANRDLTVTYALITTARRGNEDGRPFGDRAGLDVWDEGRSPLCDLSDLRAFLGELDLGRDLGEFLRSATDDEVRSELVRRVRWVTDEPERWGIRDRVERRVVLHGDRLGLSPGQSKPAVDALYTRAWDVVTSEGDRRLDRRSFLETFEEATAVLTPRSVLAAPGGGSGALAARVERVLSDSATVLVRTPVARAGLVHDVRRQLAGSEILALTGSSGMGKSTLAALVAEAGGAWVRLDLRGKGEADAADLFDLAMLAVEQLPEGCAVVVDDMPAADAGRLDRPLTGLVRAVQRRGGRVLVTSQTPIPDAVLAAVGKSSAQAHVEVPPLSADELRELCAAHGCPDDRAGQWARVIEIQTSGHPQLAAAHARNLAERGWGRVAAADLFGTPPPIERVKREARRRLVAQLDQLDAAALAYRLSVYVGPFTRAQALRFAGTTPAIPMAGAALDILTGPWLERVDDEHLRVSPLLGKSYASQFDSATVKRLQHAAALSFLEPTLTPRALNGLLLHGLAGECDEALIAAFQSVTHLDEDAFGALAEWISWLAYAATDGEPRPLYPPDPLVSLFLRQLQVRVSLALGKEDAAVAAIQAALLELDAAGTVGVALTSEMLRYQFASQAVLAVEGPEHLPFILRQAATVARIAEDGLLREMEAAAERAGLLSPPFDENAEIGSLDDVVGPTMSVLAVRIRTAKHLDLLLDAVEQEPVLERTLAPLFRDDVPASAAVTDGTWLSASREDEAGGEVDWDAVVATLQRTIGYARAQGFSALGTCARRSLATVLREYLHDRDAALAVLDGGDSGRPELEEYRAKMLVLDGEHEAALDVYRRVLPRWASGIGRANTMRAYAYQDAVRSAGMVGRWEEAARLAERGAAVADEELAGISSPLPTGYRADRAFALYRAGRYSESIAAFTQVLEALDDAPAQQGFGVLRGRVGHTLVLIEQELTHQPAPEGYAAPYVGVFSRPEPDHADFEAPASPVLVWGRLAHIEDLVGVEVGVTEKFLLMSEGKEDRLVAHDRAQRITVAAIKSGDPDLIGTIHESFRRAALGAGRPENEADRFRYEVARTAFGLASIAAAAERRLHALPVAAWVEDALSRLGPADEGTRAVRRWEETARLASSLERGDRRAAPLLRQRMVNDGEDAANRATAAAALALHSEDPDTRFYAKTTVLQFALIQVFSEEFGPSVAAIVTGDRCHGYRGAAQSLLSMETRVRLSEGVRGLLADIARRASIHEHIES